VGDKRASCNRGAGKPAEAVVFKAVGKAVVQYGCKLACKVVLVGNCCACLCHACKTIVFNVVA